MKRIKKFGILQTAKVGAVIMFFISLVVLVPFALIGGLAGIVGGSSFPAFPFAGAFVLVIPFIYGIVGFIMTAISCAVYNIISAWMGGIEVEIETVDE